MPTTGIQRTYKTAALSPRLQELVLSVFELREAGFQDLKRLHYPAAASDTSLRRDLATLTREHYLIAKRVPMLGRSGRPPYSWVIGKAAIPFIAVAANLTLEQATARQRHDERLSHLWFPHRSLMNAVRISLMLSCRAHGFSLPVWVSDDEFRLRREHVTQARTTRLLFPDAFCVLRAGARDAPLCWEAQHHSKPALYRKKLTAYSDWVDSGAFTASFGYRSLRVLAVTDSRQRAANLKEVADERPRPWRFWAASIEDMQQDLAVARVWFVGGTATLSSLVENEMMEAGKV